MATLEEALAPLLDPIESGRAASNEAAAAKAAATIVNSLILSGVDPKSPALVEALDKITDPNLRAQIAAQMPKALEAFGESGGITQLEQIAQRRDDALRQIEMERRTQSGQLDFSRDTQLRDLGINKERMLRDLLFGHEGALHDLGELKRSIMDDIAGRGLWNSGATPWENKEADWRLGRENTQYGYGVNDANQNYQVGTSDANRAYQLQMDALNSLLGERGMLANRDFSQDSAAALLGVLGGITGTTGDYAGSVAGNTTTYNNQLLDLANTPQGQWLIEQAFAQPAAAPPPPPPPPGGGITPTGQPAPPPPGALTNMFGPVPGGVGAGALPGGTGGGLTPTGPVPKKKTMSPIMYIR